jgi:hypothetical protein
MQRHDNIESNDTMHDEELESRIRREVIIVDDILNDEEEGFDDEEHEAHESGESGEAQSKKRERTWMLFTTGGILTEGTRRLSRHFIAIAIMCFLSICLTFISLNAGHEQRRKEKQITILHERSVVKEELRHELSSKSAITERLRKHNIELIDLSKDSRLIEK